MDVVESTEIVDLGVVLERELMECRKMCADMELEMKLKNSEFECLEHKYRDVVVENLAFEEEVGVLKKKYDELEKRIPGKEDVEEKVLKLMVENEVLKCEWKKAESEVEFWKAKFEALESRVMELESKDKDYNLAGKVKSEIGLSETGIKEMNESSFPTCSAHLQAETEVRKGRKTMHNVAGKITTPRHSVKGTKNFHVSGETHLTETPRKHLMHDESGEQCSLPGTENVYGSQVRKQTYGEGCFSKKMAPSTPGGVKCAPVGVVDISDSDGEHELTIPNTSTLENQDDKSVSTDPVGVNSNIKEVASENEIEEAFLDQSDNEDMVGGQGSSLLNATRKRRRASNIVNSDSENEDVLLSELIIDTQPESVTDFQSNSSPAHGTVSGNNVHKTASKRRLVTLGNAVSTPKRKGLSNIVNNNTGSEDDVDVDDDDDDDDVPISKLVTDSSAVPAALSRRRLASLRKFKENWLQKSSNTRSTLEKNCQPGISREDDSEDDIEENESESEGDSMGDFIVDDPDISEKSDSDDSSSIKSDSGNSLSRNSDHSEASGDSENLFGNDLTFGEIISKFKSNRDNQTSKWEFEADMLADFGKDPKLCMKAVCALYRQQTSEEQSSKGTIYRNHRGFSHCDAYRGTSLAEFLTNGDPHGDLRKSVEELKQYSAKGIKLCRELANHYSKQLFEIYKNKEDPLFLPEEVRD